MQYDKLTFGARFLTIAPALVTVTPRTDIVLVNIVLIIMTLYGRVKWTLSYELEPT